LALTSIGFAGAVLFGLLVGVLSALLGVGGGVVMVPFIVLALSVGQHTAEGTSLLVIVPTAAVGVIAHHRSGFVSFLSGALMGVGGIVGSFIGAAIALEFSAGFLETLFGAFVIMMGVRLIVQGARGRK
jgi:uncharacterized membrane protein YfcA